MLLLHKTYKIKSFCLVSSSLELLAPTEPPKISDVTLSCSEFCCRAEYAKKKCIQWNISHSMGSANEEAVSHLNQTHMEVRHSEVLTQRKDEFRDTFGVQTETPEKME